MNERRLLSLAHVSRVLGVHVRTVYRWVDRGHVAHVRVGSRRYVTAAELTRLTTEKRNAPVSEGVSASRRA